MKYREIPDIAVLRKLFTIENGQLISVSSGNVAGWLALDGYMAVSVNNVMLKAHRIAYKMHFGVDPDGIVDHINGNTLDNSKSNLRLANKSINAKNSKLRTDSTSGCPGISFDKSRSKWRAYITNNNKRIDIGRFNTLFDAVCARKSLQNKMSFTHRHGDQ